ncbi:MAG: DUF3539 family protein [Oscillatoria sp. SIO1A7]|nr:DUF3539 family protein [Oscillatoria sp. SIO1A7]
MSSETYLNHPNFGMLYRICVLDDNQELFTTLYAQRLFFVVINGPDGIKFDPIARADARIKVENRLRMLRRMGSTEDYQQLQAIHRRTFL